MRDAGFVDFCIAKMRPCDPKSKSSSSSSSAQEAAAGFACSALSSLTFACMANTSTSDDRIGKEKAFAISISSRPGFWEGIGHALQSPHIHAPLLAASLAIAYVGFSDYGVSLEFWKSWAPLIARAVQRGTLPNLLEELKRVPMYRLIPGPAAFMSEEPDAKILELFSGTSSRSIFSQFCA